MSFQASIRIEPLALELPNHYILYSLMFARFLFFASTHENESTEVSRMQSSCWCVLQALCR